MWDGIGCDLHMSDGLDVSLCSQAVVRCWIYNWCSSLCPLLDIPMVPGRHRPNPVLTLQHELGVESSGEESSIDDSSSDTASIISFSSARGGTDQDISDLSDVESLDSSDSLRREVQERFSQIKLQNLHKFNQEKPSINLALTAASSNESLNTCSVTSAGSITSTCSRKDFMERIKKRIQAKKTGDKMSMGAGNSAPTN
jgi:hypothetical protein